MKYTFIRVLCVTMLFCFWAQAAQAQRDYDIAQFNAVAGAGHLNTEAIQRAIDKAAVKGGRVIIPPGIFRTGSLQLRSGVELHLQAEAVLQGSTDPSHYRVIKGRYALVVAVDENNVQITGRGTVDGSGMKVALAIDSLHHTGIRPDTSYNHRRKRPGTRPMIIDFRNCRNITVRGITIRDSPSWVQNYSMCENVVLDSLTINSVAFWNNDGIDISGCRKVRISNCFVNAADDGICLKSENSGEINEDIEIRNCRIRSSASAVKFGTASASAFRNIVIDNVQVFDTYRSAIALESVDGGLIENVRVSNVVATNTGNAIFLRLGHRNASGPVGSLRNVTISNMRVQVPFDRPDRDYDLRGPDLTYFHNPFPASIAGIPGHHIENVVLENIEITYPGRASKGMAYVPTWRLSDVPEQEGEYPEFTMFGELPSWAFYVRHVTGLQLKNVSVKLEANDFRPAFVLDDVRKASLEQVTVPANAVTPSLVLNNSDVPAMDSMTSQSLSINK